MNRPFWLGVTTLVAITSVNEASAQVSCGATIGPSSQPIAMTQDISCPGISTDDAIRLVGPVTLEMRGHTITCIGRNNDGVRMTGSQARLIGPGKIVDCADGVFLTGEGSHTVRRVTIGPSQSLLSDGMVAFSPDNTINSNIIRRMSFDGLKIFAGSDGNTISFNRINRVGKSGIRFVESEVEGVAESNLISDNFISNIEDFGLDVPESTDVRRNTIIGVGKDGIAVFPGNAGSLGAPTSIINNKVRGASEHGIHLQPLTAGVIVERNRVKNAGSIGIRVGLRSLDNTIEANNVSGSVQSDLADDNRACDGNRWSQNAFGSRSRACVE